MSDTGAQSTAIADDDWSIGPADADVTLLEYGDFECPYCGALRPVLESLVAAGSVGVRLVYRHFPVTAIHPHAGIAAEAAEAAGAQGRFWEMHGVLYDNQDALEPEDLRAYAELVGLDVDRFDADMQARRFLPEVRADFRQGVYDGVNGTPTLFIEGVRYDGPRDRASLLTAIAAVRAGTTAAPR